MLQEHEDGAVELHTDLGEHGADLSGLTRAGRKRSYTPMAESVFEGMENRRLKVMGAMQVGAIASALAAAHFLSSRVVDAVLGFLG